MRSTCSTVLSLERFFWALPSELGTFRSTSKSTKLLDLYELIDGMLNSYGLITWILLFTQDPENFSHTMSCLLTPLSTRRSRVSKPGRCAPI